MNKRKKVLDTNDLLDEVVGLLNQNRAVEIIVTGHSMLPFYKHGKTIVRLKADRVYQKYDVVLFKYNKQYILHRIIKIKGDVYTLRGDGAFRKEVVHKDAIYAKVIDFNLNGRRVKFYRFKYRLWLLATPIRRILLKLVKKIDLNYSSS